FAGRLEIDRLSGNLVNDLFAGGVRLYDDDGELVLSADSVVAEPSWRGLLRRTITLGSLTLYRPEVHLSRTDSDWNIAEALASRSDSPRDTVSTRSPWSFTTLRLRIEDGRIDARNPGSKPAIIEQGHLFD